MPDDLSLVSRREAIRRVTALLGGVALVGGSSLLTGCRDGARDPEFRPFSADEIAFLDEVADTILPTTSTPGAKAAQTGAFMALMVTDGYSPDDQRTFRNGMRTIDDESEKMHGVSFMQATPQQRLALLERLDREQKAHSDSRREASRRKALAWLEDPRQESELGTDAGAAAAITADTPAHYFRMMKELALLGYFTSEIGATQAQRYVESPGRFDPCAPYTPGDKSWAPHA